MDPTKWANVNMRGDYHNLHAIRTHGSRTYYVSVPDQSDADTFRSDLNPSAISFDPRPQANMNSIRNDGQVDAEHRLLQMMAIVPMACVSASSRASKHGGYAKVSVSFNVVLKWKNEYIPV